MVSTAPIITLLTDFGSRDTYVGQMKGAILSVCPQARLVDLTHEIPPGDVAAAAGAWNDAVPAFPPETVHLAIVDPGVGSARRAIAVEIGDRRFVCPDNGLLTRLLHDGPAPRAVELNNPIFWRANVSPVFHGRDLFGPVAGHWAAGRDLTEFGPLVISPLMTLELPAAVTDGHSVQGIVIGIDRFGNLRTNLSANCLTGPPDTWSVEIGGETIPEVSRYYGAVAAGQLIALIGSHGDLEIGVNQGDAAQRLEAAPGTLVIARRRRQNP